MEEANRSKPGIGTYTMTKSLKDLQADNKKFKEKIILPSSKRYFYENTENLSNGVPGMGNYSPHLSVDTFKLNKTNHTFWLAKHKKYDSVILSRDLKKPNPATYQPTNQSFNTFQKTFSLPKK